MVQGRKTAKTKRRLTLQHLLKEELPVWVVNKTGEVGTQEPAIVSIQVGSGDNWSSIKIPPGRDPVCITDWVDPVSLRSCRDLFTLVRKGILELKDPDKAEEYYEINDERKRIMDEKLEKYMSEKKEEELPTPRPAESSQVLNPKIDSICMRAREGAIKERDALERLVEQESVLKEADYEYLLRNGVFESVKKWAKEHLG